MYSRHSNEGGRKMEVTRIFLFGGATQFSCIGSFLRVSGICLILNDNKDGAGAKTKVSQDDSYP